MSAADAWAAADPTECPVCGLDSCVEHLPARRPNEHSRPVLHVQHARDVISAPRPLEIVEGLAWAQCVTVLVSESGTGKTFLLLDLASAISDGVQWHGRAVHQGSVVYISFEGDALSLRLRALRDVGGRRLDHLYILHPPDPLSPRASRDGEVPSLGEVMVTAALTTLAGELQREGLPPIVLVIIDTVRASMTGSEDASEHVSAYLRAVRRVVSRAPRAAVILAHHAGWQDGETKRKRERGSSSWRGNCDATVYLEADGPYDAERGEAPLTLQTLKVRDVERPAPLSLVRRRVELLEMDRHGGPVTSCLIERDPRSRADRDAERTAAVAAHDRETDLKVLQAMRDYPTATSITRLRPYVGLRTDAVSASVARILREKLATEGKRGQPYTLTEAGQMALAKGSI